MKNQQSKFRVKEKGKNTLSCKEFGIKCLKCKLKDTCKFRKSYKQNFGSYPENDDTLIKKQLEKRRYNL